jgi:hypothetical protein
MDNAPRSLLIRLMADMGLKRATLSGDNRARHSTRKLQTMQTLFDPVEYFRKAMSIELEHGGVNRLTDVTHDDLRQTAKIVAAHIFGVEHGERPGNWRFFPSYYDELIRMETRAPRLSLGNLSRRV